MSLPTPTALGVKALLFYLLMLGAYVATPYSNLFFMLLTFLTVLGALNVVWTLRNASGMRATVEEVEPVPAGAALPLRGVIESDGVALAIEMEVEGAGTLRLPGELKPLPRGIYRVGRTRLVSTWPLGLLKVARPVDAPKELIVYPEPADLTEARGGDGDHLPGASSDYLQPAGLREYRPGDEFRAIHWRATARRGRPVVKEWDGGAGSGSEVVLDRRTDVESLEESLSLLSALACMAREQKEPLTIHSQELSATYGSGHRPWRDCFAFLAAALTLPSDAAPPPPTSPHVTRLPR